MVLHHIVQIDSIDHDVDGVFALAGGIKCERTLATNWLRKKTIGWRCHRSGRQETEVEEVAAVQRYFLDGLLVDDLTDRYGAVIDYRRFSRDRHLLR